MILEIDHALKTDLLAACALIKTLGDPALVADEDLIIKAKNEALSELMPYLRCGAALEKYVGRRDASKIASIARGASLAFRSTDNPSLSLIAAHGDGHFAVFFDTVAARLRVCVKEAYDDSPGYDNRFPASFGERLVSPRIKSGFTERMNRHLADLVGCISGVVTSSAPSCFNAASALRGVAAAVREFASARGYRFNSEDLPATLHALGSERDFITIIAVAAADCAYLSRNGEVNVAGTLDEGIAEVTVSCVTDTDEIRLAPLCRERIDRRSLADDATGFLQDVYLMRLLASGNIWELSAASADEAGGKRFSVKLRFAVCDEVLRSRFELCDTLDLAAYEAARREIAFLPDRTKN